MSEQSTFESEESSSAPSNAINSLKLLSLLLLVPVMLLCNAIQLSPALDTFSTSRTDNNFLTQENQNVGFENYDRLFEDRLIKDALGFTARLTFARVLIVATIPLLVGLLVGVQPRLPRLLNRLSLSVIIVVLSPPILVILWYFFFGMTWDFDTFEPSPLNPIPDSLALRDVDGAKNNLQLLDMAITTGMAVGLGSLAFMAVARGRKLSKEPVLAGAAVWFVSVLVAIASFTQTFDLPYLLTRGGPANATSTLALHKFNAAFIRFDFGYGSALAFLEITLIAGIAFCIWAVITGLNIRLRYLPNEDESSDTAFLSIFSLPLIFLLGLPVVGLLLWGLWVMLSNGGFSPVFEDVDWNQLLGNSFAAPWIIIWIIQLPFAYVAALTLGFFRPLGRIWSSVLFLPFVIFAMMPAPVLQFAWFDMLREMDALGGTFTSQTLPWFFSGLSLIVLKMFFDGAHDAYQEAVTGGQPSGDAFTRQVFLPSLPIALAIGVLLSLFATGDLLWPLIVSIDPEDYTVTLHLARILGTGLAPGPVAIGTAVFYGGLIALIFLPFVALLNIFALDRLALVAGAAVAAEEPEQSDNNLQPEEAVEAPDAEEPESSDDSEPEAESAD